MDISEIHSSNFIFVTKENKCVKSDACMTIDTNFVVNTYIMPAAILKKYHILNHKSFGKSTPSNTLQYRSKYYLR